MSRETCSLSFITCVDTVFVTITFEFTMRNLVTFLLLSHVNLMCVERYFWKLRISIFIMRLWHFLIVLFVLDNIYVNWFCYISNFCEGVCYIKNLCFNSNWNTFLLQVKNTFVVLSDYNWTRNHNHLVRQQTLNHLVWIHSERCVWHDKNIKFVVLFLFWIGIPNITRVFFISIVNSVNPDT